MAGSKFTTPSQTFGSKVLNGGLNSTSGTLFNQDNESTDLLNIDFNKFGSILKRYGYASAGTTGTKASDGLHWMEFVSGGTSGEKLINVSGGKFYYTVLAGVFTDVTGGISITSGQHCDFENFTNKVFCTNGTDTPFFYAGSGTCGVASVPTGVTKIKYTRQFNNYLFYANMAVAGTDTPSRIYWSNIKDPTTWNSDKFIEISKDDGQEITGLKALGDRLVVFKERSIYNVTFTGDADFEFILPGGGKSNSAVGCVAPWSIQEVENGLVFLSYDGLYYYDGNNSTKLSYKVDASLGIDMSTSPSYQFDRTKFANAVSCVQKSKNRYFLALQNSLPAASTNSGILVWDWYNIAFSIYSGMSPAAMATAYVTKVDERPYFADYNGYTYRMDTGNDDYPLNVKTAIKSYYYTNWRYFDDLVDQKGVPNVYIYYGINDTILTFAYSYEFEESDQYSLTFSMATAADTFGTGLYGTAKYAGSGGLVRRLDLTGRGRVIRLKFENNNMTETFRIDGLGTYVHAETNV